MEEVLCEDVEDVEEDEDDEEEERRYWEEENRRLARSSRVPLEDP